LVLSTKRLVAATKKIVVPYFVAVTKPFFPCVSLFINRDLSHFSFISMLLKVYLAGGI